jgi:hypothetical protein
MTGTRDDRKKGPSGPGGKASPSITPEGLENSRAEKSRPLTADSTGFPLGAFFSKAPRGGEFLTCPIKAPSSTRCNLVATLRMASARRPASLPVPCGSGRYSSGPLASRRPISAAIQTRGRTSRRSSRASAARPCGRPAAKAAAYRDATSTVSDEPITPRSPETLTINGSSMTISHDADRSRHDSVRAAAPEV